MMVFFKPNEIFLTTVNYQTIVKYIKIYHKAEHFQICPCFEECKTGQYLTLNRVLGAEDKFVEDVDKHKKQD